MSYFINLKNGKAQIDTSRLIDAAVTDMSDILNQANNPNSETLSASIDIWISEESQRLLNKLDSFTFESLNDLKSYLLEEGDFLDLTMGYLNIDHTEFPQIRADQLSSFNDYANEKFGANVY